MIFLWFLFGSGDSRKESCAAADRSRGTSRRSRGTVAPLTRNKRHHSAAPHCGTKRHHSAEPAAPLTQHQRHHSRGTSGTTLRHQRYHSRGTSGTTLQHQRHHSRGTSGTATWNRGPPLRNGAAALSFLLSPLPFIHCEQPHSELFYLVPGQYLTGTVDITVSQVSSLAVPSECPVGCELVNLCFTASSPLEAGFYKTNDFKGIFWSSRK